MGVRIRQAMLLIAVIAAATGGMSWNAARTAAPPTAGGIRDVERRDLTWTDAGRSVHAVAYVPAGRDRLPTLLFSPGFSVGAGDYATFLTDIASHGFLVVAVPHPPITDPDNAQLIDVQPVAARSLVLAMDHIARSGRDSVLGRVDTARVAAFGHSIGGAAAAHACYDGRFKAAVDVDGSLYGRVVHEGVRCPFLLIQRTLRVTDTLDAPVFYEHRSQGRLHEDSVRAHTRQMAWVTIDGLDHMSFTDASLGFETRNWFSETVGMRLNAARAQRRTADLLLEFFARHLGVTLDKP